MSRHPPYALNLPGGQVPQIPTNTARLAHRQIVTNVRRNSCDRKLLFVFICESCPPDNIRKKPAIQKLMLPPPFRFCEILKLRNQLSSRLSYEMYCIAIHRGRVTKKLIDFGTPSVRQFCFLILLLVAYVSHRIHVAPRVASENKIVLINIHQIWKEMAFRMTLLLFNPSFRLFHTDSSEKPIFLICFRLIRACPPSAAHRALAGGD